VDLSVWSNVELPVGVICACMPSIRSLFARFVPTIFNLTTKGEPSANSSMPKRVNLSITPKPRRHSSKLGTLDDGSFVELVESKSWNQTKA
jgi:hypothetical protein